MPKVLVVPQPQALLDLVGKELPPSDWFELTQDQIQRFAEATEDRQWIHVSPERAQRESPYGATIAHGFLTLSLLTHLLHETLQITGGLRMIINYGLNRVRFPSPVPSGARVRARFAVQSVRQLTDALEAVFLATVEIEGGAKPACVTEWVLRYYLADAHGEA